MSVQTKWSDCSFTSWNHHLSVGIWKTIKCKRKEKKNHKETSLDPEEKSFGENKFICFYNLLASLTLLWTQGKIWEVPFSVPDWYCLWTACTPATAPLSSRGNTMPHSRARPQKMMSSTLNLIHDQDVEGSLPPLSLATEDEQEASLKHEEKGRLRFLPNRMNLNELT